jgi:outer membrane lipoprotein-sorting protein
MAAKRPARPTLIRISQITIKSRTINPITIKSIVRQAAIAAVALIASMVVTAVALTEPAVAENVPLPVPAPLPKTGVAPPAAAAPAKTSETRSPAETRPPGETRPSPSFNPFSALFGNKSSNSSSSAVSEPSSPFDAKQRALLDRVSAYLSSVQTMVGKFVQVGPDGGRTEGIFYIQKPGRVRFEYNPPSPIDIVADGSSVVVRDRKLATQDLYPLSQTPLRYLLADRIDLLRDTDVVSVTSDNSFVTVVIEQKQLLVGTDRLMMMFDAKDLMLKQWTVTDPQGFDTTVAVYNLDSTKKPDPNLFVINYQRDQGGIQ